MNELSVSEKYNMMANRIDKILKTSEFSFDVTFLKAIHKYLFAGLLENAGEFRQKNLYRIEPILDGESVAYSNYFNIEKYLIYDMQQEKLENYHSLDQEKFISAICLLNTKLWLTHPFNDGNTRTISVFMRLLFNKLGYTFDNEEFRKHFSYYRDALVLASYSTPRISPNEKYLQQFFKKILFTPGLALENINICYEKINVLKKRTH